MYVFVFVNVLIVFCFFFFFQAEDGIRDHCVTGVQTCALPIFALRVRLEEGRLQVQLPGVALDPRLELGEGEVAVDVVVPTAQHVEVDAVQDLDAVASYGTHRSSSTTARTLSGSTR